MTLSELEQTLPNGFHDAFLDDFTLVLSKGTAALSVSVDISGSNASSGEYKTVMIMLSGVVAFVFDVPWIGESLDCPLDICSFATSEKQYPGFSKIPPEIQKLFLSFFVGDPWNNFIHIAATEAEIVWKAGAE